ncbi:uncharacterized protein DS421_15g503830 [Arachis hypogaea]|nr:uncharacterized protein DS421_15g503830 [Arachis hypogaea]
MDSSASYLPLWKIVPACHAQGLACHAHHFALVPVAGISRPASKWHAQVRILSWCATPSTPGGTPSLCFGLLCTLACHAYMLKWHAQVRVEAWRATPSISSGTPSLFKLQPLLWNLVLACHAILIKWQAQVIFKAGVPRLRYQVARPWLKWWVRRATPLWWPSLLFSGNLYWRAMPSF